MSIVKINTIKFEIVGGKKVGKAFSFPMDAKKMAKHKTEATVKKKVEEYVAKSGVFKKTELKDLKYDMRDFLEEWKRQKVIVEEEELKKLEQTDNEKENRVTPANIEKLGNNEYFVFGSNAAGRHGGGAARVAVEKFGAIMGQGHGVQGKCYAIDTMSGLPAMKEDVNKFLEFASHNKTRHFFVTPIGCGIAGYRPEDVAPLFEGAKEMDNISLPESFWKLLGGLPSKKEYDLCRFVEAHCRDFPRALDQIRKGRKTGHWIWYIFPQQKGFGHSHNTKFYALDGVAEARAFYEHPILGKNLREICEALLTHKRESIDTIMGSDVDVMKLQTCMNLFNKVKPNDIFQQVLDAFF